jgi:prephenate dehydrogenase
MINAAIVGLGWWGRIIHRELSVSKVIRPVLGIDPAEAAREGALAAGLATASRFEDALARDDIDRSLPRPARASMCSARSPSARPPTRWRPSPRQ